MALYSVAGTATPGQGTMVAFDGARTGEVAKATIQDTNVDIVDANTGCLMKGLVKAHKDSTTLAEPGDSGGPVIVHTNTNLVVNAAGTIQGCLITNGVEDPTTCFYVTIARAMDAGNGTILKG